MIVDRPGSWGPTGPDGVRSCMVEFVICTPARKGTMPGPLEGIRIFDLTIYMVGPWASMHLGALGADVIHIEQPNVDPSSLSAAVPPRINGTSIGFITWNMNKRGLFLDLKSPEDRATAYELLKTCDVFMINM